jgi:anti-sigma factor RsiW
MSKTYTQAELEAYLDEALPAERMARIEQALRSDRELVRQLSAINARRDAGVHSLGEIWRRHRPSCPTREQLGSYVLGALPAEISDYVEIHIEAVGCRLCRANLGDLQKQQAEAADVAQTRRRKYFQSSAGYLRPGKKP